MKMLIIAQRYFLPLLAFALLSLGLFKRSLTYVLVAMWVSLIALLLQYQAGGGEILGSHYFGYKNASLYSGTLLITLISLLYLLLNSSTLRSRYVHYLTGFLSLGFTLAALVLLVNLWINAYFIENRLPGTAIMQVVTYTPPEYCSSRYTFYKITSNGKISYLCPNYYGILPAIGYLQVAPNFLTQPLIRRKLSQKDRSF
jgi:hypothetical protein